MENVLDVIKYARESYLSKEHQLDVIQDAYSKWLRGEKFEPSKLVEAAEQSVHPTLRESAKCECDGKYYHADCKLVYRSPQSG